MRRSPVRDLLADRGAVFEERSGVEVAMRFSSFEEEYRAVREAVGVTDFSFTTRHKVHEDGLDVFERYAAGSVANIRFGRVLHTLAANADGHVEADLYIANDDEELILIGENLIEDAACAAVLEELGGSEAGLVDITTETALIGIDGFRAWAVAKDLLGTDVLGLPYLSIETYELDGQEVKLIRAGKTSEFGYLFLVSADMAAALMERIEKAGEPHGMKHIGLETHMGLRLDGRFFNVHAEGAAVRDPLMLGLQWMMDFEGEDFLGREAIMARRAAGVAKKIVGVVPDEPDSGLATGDKILHQDRAVAEVVTASDSPTLGTRIGLALFDWEYAYSGLDFEGEDGRTIRTISLPPFTARSLTIRLDEV